MTSDSFDQPHSDPLGLYRELGLTPSATMDEIKAASRSPYYIPSGDDSDKAFAEAFRQAREAYDTLSDPARKANYDRFACGLPEAGGDADRARKVDLRHVASGPTHCSGCGRLTPLPRYVEMSQLIGPPTVRATKSTSEGLLCGDCAKSYARKSAVVTLLFGFLSRGGPFRATWTWLKNGYRGRHDKVVDAQLALHNARAFLAAGDVRLAYAVAKVSSRSGDAEIARQSALILREIEAAGGDYWNYSLPDPWVVSTTEKILFAFLPFVIPAALVAFLYGYAEWRHSQDRQASLTVDGVPVEVCAHPPETKGFLTPRTDAHGDLTLRIWNRAPQNAVVKVRDRNSAVVASVFLKRNDSLDITGLPSGNYKIQFELGYRFDKTCKAFVNPWDVHEMGEFSKTVISPFSSGREIIGYELVGDSYSNRPLSKVEFEQGS